MASTDHNVDSSDPNSSESHIMDSSQNPEEQQQVHHQHHQHQHQQHHHPHTYPPISQPVLHTHMPPAPSLPLRSASSTPMSSPGLFSPTGLRHVSALPTSSVSESNTPVAASGSPYLHPLQTHKVRETHKALIDSDNITGRKLINQYEVIEEIGRGMHGKVKLARNLETGENVAIKIIPRFSKKRRLGRVTAKSPEDKTMKEIAILKKIRHPNVVALLEVIDDPELKKIYMVLEHVELGEIVWRKKGLPHICQYERRRIEREMRGEPPTGEEEKYDQILERRQALKELKRAKMAQNYAGPSDYWSVEYGAADEGSSAGRQSRIPSKEDFSILDGRSSRPSSRPGSRAPSRSQSVTSMFPPSELDEEVDWEDDMETPGPLRSNTNSATALDGTMYGAYADEGFRGRSPSMADSIISHMSSIDYNQHNHDTFSDDYSYVPCFSFEQARSTFRDTVLGLEYLHYQGVVHRDIKPANLLWTRDHRVRISDFGVSYFGRPIREGEVDETVSESEARDFDDDLELAKTVGTPAFFAPELCYTDIEQEQPKVSEQIDVWSLGVTLYCLIYARIPFLAEDEFQMFRKIATDEVYIPRRRLKPVDPSTSPASTSLYKRQNTYPYRDDSDLEYEDVDNLLFDLLRLMLTKNPEKRIRLRDIKRHPWVVQGIPNPIGWLDDTDPARPSSGRRIQVDERDMSFAVVPLTFLERARSVVKKAVGKVMHPLVERSDSKSRRRATSSAASSAGESLLNSVPPTPQQYRTDRRRSIRPDDYFADAISESPVTDNHMPSGSVNTRTESMPYDPLATVLPLGDVSRDHSRSGSADIKEGSGSSRLSLRLGQTYGKLAQHVLHMEPSMDAHDAQTTPSTPFYDGHNDAEGDDTGSARSTRAMASVNDETTRSRSVDRGLFASSDKRAHAQVALSSATAPGSIHGPKSPRPMKSIELSKIKVGHGPASPLCASQTLSQRPPGSDPNIHGRQQTYVAERPQTAHRVETVPDAKSPPPRVYNTSNAESFARAKEVLWRKEELELGDTKRRSIEVNPVNIPCPPSPDDDTWPEHPGGPSRAHTMTTGKSSSTESMEGLGTPLTAPSEVTSPVSAHPPVKNTSERMLAFQSDPSLPALLSGASSVSADMEGELLGRPGVVNTRAALLETSDSLTPPALAKEPTSGFPIGNVFENPPAMESGTLNVHYQPGSRPTTPSMTAPSRQMFDDDDDDDDDDGSDDGILIMAKSRKKMASPVSKPRGPPLRRDTNASTASNETAKKVPVHTEEASLQTEA